jgi:hypothetical protein
MTILPIGIVAGALLLVALGLPVLAAFGYALAKWCREARTIPLPMWRRVAAFIGVVAVIVQGGLFFAFWHWPQISRDNMLFSAWARWSFAAFLVALFVLAGKGVSRWGLLSLALLLFAVSFFITLTP